MTDDVRAEWRREHRRNPGIRAALALIRFFAVPRWFTREEFDAETDRMLGLAPHEVDAERRRAMRKLQRELRVIHNTRPPGDAA